MFDWLSFSFYHQCLEFHFLTSQLSALLFLLYQKAVAAINNKLLIYCCYSFLWLACFALKLCRNSGTQSNTHLHFICYWPAGSEMMLDLMVTSYVWFPDLLPEPVSPVLSSSWTTGPESPSTCNSMMCGSPDLLPEPVSCLKLFLDHQTRQSNKCY